MPHPISKTPLIFAAFANNEAAPLRKLALEQDDIKDIFEAPRLQGKCEICTQTAASPETIVKQFQKHHDRIRIFHYGGHSDQDTLFLYKDFALQDPTKSTDLATFLANQPNLELVFINGCLSIQQAEKYHRAGVKAIIATDRRVDDEQAREFAVSFYRGLAGGASISTGFQMAVDSFPMIRGGNFRAQGWENDQQQGQALPWKLFPEGPHDWRLPIVPRELTQIPVIDLSERFLGREKEMDQLEKMLETSSTGVLISGIGGIGKSRLASAYVELFDKKYDHLAWINADRDIITTIALHPELADTLDLPFENGEAVQDRLRRILWELQKLPGRNLLVIDNASEQIAQKEIYTHLPTAPKWQKIITSRRQIPGFDPLELGTFSLTAAKDLFLMISPKAETDEGLEDLLQEIEYHPLTIELFARLFNNLNATCTLTELTATLRQQQLANLSQKIWVDYHPEEQTVYAHLQAAFDISREILTGFEIWLLKQFIVLPAADYPIPHLAELLQDELHLRKFFQVDHEDTKLAQKFLTWALRVGRKKRSAAELLAFVKNSRKLPDQTGIIDFLNTQLNALAGKGWLIRHPDGSFSIHRLIQRMVEFQLQSDLLDLKGLLENLIRKTNADPFVNVFADQIRWLQPAKSLAGYLHNYKKLPLADLQDNIAQLLHAAGDNKEALQYGDQALALRRKFLHSRHPKVVTSYNNISMVYHSLGQYEEALKSARQSQKIQEALSKPDIANLAICYNNLAMSYRELGRTEEALTFLKRSLPLMKAHLGETHPNVARCLQNIAHCYNQEGNYQEALVYNQKAVKITEAIFDDHPDLALSCHNIGCTYYSLGDYEQARKFHKKARNIWEQSVYGPQPDQVTCYNNLACIYQDLKQYDKAIKYYRKAIKLAEKLWPAQEQRLLGLYDSLADTYFRQGDYDATLKYGLKILTLLEDTLPPEHAEIKDAYLKLAEIHRHFGQEDQAAIYEAAAGKL